MTKIRIFVKNENETKIEKSKSSKPQVKYKRYTINITVDVYNGGLQRVDGMSS